MKKALVFMVLSLFSFGVGAEDAERERSFSLSVTSDFAYYPKSMFKAGAAHFSPVTNIYRTVAAQSVIQADWHLPVWHTKNPLFKSNNIAFETGLGITPCSIYPQAKVIFTPIAFMNMYAGLKMGSGWNFGTVHGLARWDDAGKGSYETLDPFSALYLYGSVGMTWMFDTAAVWEGDWHHIVMLLNFELAYECLLGTDATIWEWETKKGLANGFISKQYFVFGYQMPIVVSMVAWQITLSGHLNGTDYGTWTKNYNGDYTLIDMGPAVQFSFGKRDQVFLAVNIRARRSFAEPHDSYGEEPKLTYTGREWILDYAAIRWKHIFK